MPQGITSTDEYPWEHAAQISTRVIYPVERMKQVQSDTTLDHWVGQGKARNVIVRRRHQRVDSYEDASVHYHAATFMVVDRNRRHIVECNLVHDHLAIPASLLADRIAGTSDWGYSWLSTDGSRHGALGKPAFYRGHSALCDRTRPHAPLFRIIQRAVFNPHAWSVFPETRRGHERP